MWQYTMYQALHSIPCTAEVCISRDHVAEYIQHIIWCSPATTFSMHCAGGHCHTVPRVLLFHIVYICCVLLHVFVPWLLLLQMLYAVYCHMFCAMVLLLLITVCCVLPHVLCCGHCCFKYHMWCVNREDYNFVWPRKYLSPHLSSWLDMKLKWLDTA